jgi:hypothetical protein
MISLPKQRRSRQTISGQLILPGGTVGNNRVVSLIQRWQEYTEVDPLQWATTASDGTYTFSNVSPGTYQICAELNTGNTKVLNDVIKVTGSDVIVNPNNTYSANCIVAVPVPTYLGDPTVGVTQGEPIAWSNTPTLAIYSPSSTGSGATIWAKMGPYPNGYPKSANYQGQGWNVIEQIVVDEPGSGYNKNEVQVVIVSGTQQTWCSNNTVLTHTISNMSIGNAVVSANTTQALAYLREIRATGNITIW